MPALLLERGLTAAVRNLAARSPLPVDVEIDAEVGRDLPASVESTAYLVVAKAVTNAVKHASAARLAIGLERSGRPCASGSPTMASAAPCRAAPACRERSTG